MRRRLLTVPALGVLFATVFAGTGWAASSNQSGSDASIQLCVKNGTGAARVATRCASTERAVKYNLAGPTGARGSAGAAGAVGAAGAKGATGDSPQGPPGAVGEPGAVGATGPVGLQGDVGSRGSAGSQGNPGAQGPTGPAGASGPTGRQGDAGPAGPAGVTGISGPAGDTGRRGPTGAAGPTGVRGSPGADGVTGWNVVTKSSEQFFGVNVYTLYFSATCKSGQVAMQGVASYSVSGSNAGGGYRVDQYASGQYNGTQGWTLAITAADASNPPASDFLATASVICVDNGSSS